MKSHGWVYLSWDATRIFFVYYRENELEKRIEWVKSKTDSLMLAGAAGQSSTLFVLLLN